jgi:hypothetical protein
VGIINDQVGQFIGGGWVNCLSVVTQVGSRGTPSVALASSGGAFLPFFLVFASPLYFGVIPIVKKDDNLKH